MLTRIAALSLAAALVVACDAPVPGGPSPTATFPSNVPCGPSERFERHAHAHLTIVIRGQLRQVPASIGIPGSTICWLHTHDTSGIIHIEAGDDRPFTLGDFFGVWRQPLGATVVAGERLGRGETLQVTENQRPFTGAPETIVLDDLDDIVLQIGPPFPTVQAYTWPQGY